MDTEAPSGPACLDDQPVPASYTDAPPPARAPRVYRHRAATAYRGVTQTRGANTGSEKYDVQIVFSDAGIKRHPKIYGFVSAEAASRAFDVLLCRRSLEKGRAPSELAAAGKSLGTNHPLEDYSSAEFASLVGTVSRDDVVYGLKAAAKKEMSLDKDSLIKDLKEVIEAVRAEAEELEQTGEARLSYEATAAGGGSGAAGAKGKRKTAGDNGDGRGRGKKRAGAAAAAAGEEEEQAPGAGPGSMAPLSLLPGFGGALGQQFMLAQRMGAPTAAPLLPSLPGMADLAGVDPATTTLAPTVGARDPVATETAAQDLVGPPNGLEFLQNVCRVAAAAGHFELHCVADLIRIWDLQRQGLPWKTHTLTLPTHLYQGAPAEAMAAAGDDLGAALAACHAMWQQHTLHGIFSKYMVALSGVAPSGHEEGGGGGADAGHPAAPFS